MVVDASGTGAGDEQIACVVRLVATMAQEGIRDVVISPGARSTPLVLVAAAHPSLRCHYIVDERSAGFFALGQARVTGRPSLLVCTSGTAGAHYLPALMEAFMGRIPLVAVTADRPAALQDRGANQTVNQLTLFGRFVRDFVSLGETGRLCRDACIAGGKRALASARHPVPGPVHINVRLEKPLEPETVEWVHRELDRFGAIAESGARDLWNEALCEDAAGTAVPSAIVDRVVTMCGRARRGLVVCGPGWTMEVEQTRGALATFLHATGFVLAAEVAADLGTLADAGVSVVSLDLLIRCGVMEHQVPEVIVQLCHFPTSAAYAAYLVRHPGIRRVVIDGVKAMDPVDASPWLVTCPVDRLLLAVAGKLKVGDTGYREALQVLDGRCQRMLAHILAEDNLFSEAHVLRVLFASLPGQGVLFVGNSMVIRDADAFAGPVSWRVVHQRGVSGIDGMLAGGAGAASVTQWPVVVVTGDVSVRHDLGSVQLLRRAGHPLVVVVVNNDGGRIFQQLPVAAFDERDQVLSRGFVMPGESDFSWFVDAGVNYARVRTQDELAKVLRRLLIDAPSRDCWVVDAHVDSVVIPNWRDAIVSRMMEALSR